MKLSEGIDLLCQDYFFNLLEKSNTHIKDEEESMNIRTKDGVSLIKTHDKYLRRGLNVYLSRLTCNLNIYLLYQILQPTNYLISLAYTRKQDGNKYIREFKGQFTKSFSPNALTLTLLHEGRKIVIKLFTNVIHICSARNEYELDLTFELTLNILELTDSWLKNMKELISMDQLPCDIKTRLPKSRILYDLKVFNQITDRELQASSNLVLKTLIEHIAIKREIRGTTISEERGRDDIYYIYSATTLSDLYSSCRYLDLMDGELELKLLEQVLCNRYFDIGVLLNHSRFAHELDNLANKYNFPLVVLHDNAVNAQEIKIVFHSQDLFSHFKFNKQYSSMIRINKSRFCQHVRSGGESDYNTLWSLLPLLSSDCFET